jgi:hypothetical protein
MTTQHTIKAPTAGKLELWVAAYHRDYPTHKYEKRVVEMVNNDTAHVIVYETTERNNK